MTFIAQMQTSLPDLPPGPSLEHVRGPVEIPKYTTGEYAAFAILGIILYLIIAYALYRFFRRKRRPAPPPPPYSIFQKTIDRIESTGETDAKAQARELSHAVRQYLQAALVGYTPGLSTAEFLSKLETHPSVNRAQAAGLQHLYQSLDRLKFARESNATASIQNLIQDAKQLIADIHEQQQKLMAEKEAAEK